MKVREADGTVRDLNANEIALIARDKADIQARRDEAQNKKDLILSLLQPTQGPVQIGVILGELNIVKAYLRQLVEEGKI